MKYKQANATGTWFCTVDENGIKSQSWNQKNKPVRFEEMKKWEAEGNEIEAFEKAEEIASREAKEAAQALEFQKQTIIQLVKSVEYHFSPVSRHPDTDGKWKEWVDKLWNIYDSEKIQELPEKPY